jgi:type IV secretory pathway VirB2 component (pilin)
MKQQLLLFAQKLTPGDGNNGTVNIPTLSPDQVLQNGLNIVYFIAAIIAVIVIIVAGIMYSTSAGNAGSVSKAKNLILYSIVGLVIIFAAFAITNFVIGRF